MRASFLFLIVLIIGFNANSQSLQITGKVIADKDKSTIPGATIQVKGTSKGTITNYDGIFSIEAASGDVLDVAFVGYEKQSIKITDQTFLEITLKESLVQLKDVVVIGYGTQKKEDLTTSITSVGEEELQKVSASSFTTALQGKAAGVLVNSESGQPGGATSIRIRGLGGLNNNEPLYVIDGIIMNSYGNNKVNPGQVGATPSNNILASINPNDIESINILKDASATAIYGSRAGNGVVLITTKKGKKGDAKISLDAYRGFQKVDKFIDLMTGPEYAAFSNDARSAAGMVSYTGYGQPDTLANTNWQDELYRTAPIQSYQISASGGNDKGDYYLSMGYFDQEGVIPNSYYNRFSLRANGNYDVNKWIRLGNTLSISQSKSNALPNGNLHSGVVLGALRIPGYIPVTSNGENNIYYGVGDYESLFAGRNANPVHSASRSYNFNTIRKATGNFYADFKILEGLVFKTNFSFDVTNSLARTFEKTFTEYPYLNQSENPVFFKDVPVASSRAYSELNTTLDLTLTYIKTFGLHSVNVMVGHTAQEFLMDNTYTTSSGHLTNSLITTAAGDPSTQVGSNSLYELAYESYIGRAQYDYAKKYYLTYSYRRDGSSRFGSGLKFASFHSISGAWRISSEKFMDPLKGYLTDMKIRASWGQTGIDGSLSSVEYPKVQNHFSYVFNGNQFVSGSAPVGVPNPSLRWETAEQYNVGLDMRFWDGLIDITADYFYKHQYDIITQKPIPFLLGITNEEYSPRFPVEVINGPEVVNTGIELIVSHQNNISELNYNISANFTRFSNEITKIEYPILSETFNGYNILINKQGSPINQFYGFKTDGLIRSESDEALNRQPNSGTGDIKYVDIDGDSQITDNDRTIIGNPIPDFAGGVNLGLEYKNLDFSMALQGVYGNDIYNANFGWIVNSKDGSNRHANMNDRWSVNNQEGTYPRAITTDPNNNSRASDFFIEDGSYLRIQNTEIGYRINDLKGISSLRFYLSGQNLHTWTNYQGYTPEVGTKGIDASVYPLAKKIILGVNVKF